MVDALELHLFVLAAPPLELALDVSVVPPQVPQPDRVRIDGVQRRQGVRHVVPDRPAGRLVEGRLRLGRVAQDVAVDELHDVERALVHGLVGAEPDGLRHGDPDRAQRVDAAVLARHVVRCGQHVVQGRPSQRPGPSLGVLHAVREVGTPARDQGEGEGRREVGQPGGHPLGDIGFIDAMRCVGHGSRR